MSVITNIEPLFLHCLFSKIKFNNVENTSLDSPKAQCKKTETHFNNIMPPSPLARHTAANVRPYEWEVNLPVASTLIISFH